MFDYRQERFDEIHEAEVYQLSAAAKPSSDQPAPLVQQPGFQLPSSVWLKMVGCYIIFFAGMAAMVAGSGYAMFMVVISMLYAIVFFSTSMVLANLSGDGDASPLDQGQKLQTWCGPMSRGAVNGQVLIVPAGIAIFGAAVAVISTVTG